MEWNKSYPKSQHRKIAEFLSRLKRRMDRGNGLNNYPLGLIEKVFQMGVYLMAIKGVLGWEVKNPLILMIILAVGMKFLDWFTGYVDERKGFWKVEAELSDREINSFQQEMMGKIDNIKEIVANMHNEQ